MNSLLNKMLNIGRYHKVAPPYGFHGGLTLAPSKRALQGPLRTLPLPETLFVPLISYGNKPVEPACNNGDQVQRGQSLANGILAPATGVVEDVRQHSFAHAGDLSTNTIVIRPSTSNTADQCALPTCSPTKEQLDALHNDPTSFLEQHAIQGLGGAAFPTGTKLSHNSNLHTLIINAAECEPEIACDEALMNAEPAAASAAIEDKVKDRNLSDKAVELVVLPTLYPTGAESPLIETLLNQKIAHGDSPTNHGIACVNVATAHAVWRALCGIKMDSRIVSLGGKGMPNPCNVRVRFGTSISFVLENTGNEAVLNEPVVTVGGPLSGFTLTDKNSPVTAEVNSITINDPVTTAQASPCIRCGYCVEVCPARLLPQQLHWYAQAEQIEECEKLNLQACIECACCDIVCPSSIPLTNTFRFAKSSLRAREIQHSKTVEAEIRFQKRDEREAERKLQKQQAIEERKAALKEAAADHNSKNDNNSDQADSISDTIARAIERNKSRANSEKKKH